MLLSKLYIIFIILIIIIKYNVLSSVPVIAYNVKIAKIVNNVMLVISCKILNVWHNVSPNTTKIAQILVIK
jgi:hypothetical protein